MKEQHVGIIALILVGVLAVAWVTRAQAYGAIGGPKDWCAWGLEKQGWNAKKCCAEGRKARIAYTVPRNNAQLDACAVYNAEEAAKKRHVASWVKKNCPVYVRKGRNWVKSNSRRNRMWRHCYKAGFRF
jgi:hypothetical protein